MPLRGTLFRKIQTIRKQRQKAEQSKFKREVISEAISLKKLRTQRVREEGRSALKRQIAIEKARISAARGPSKIGVIEKLIQKQAAGLGKVAAKELKKRQARVRAGKPVFGTLAQETGLKGTRRKKRTKRKKRGK